MRKRKNMKKIISILIIGFLLNSGAWFLVQARDSIDDCGCNDKQKIGYYEKLFPMLSDINGSIVSDLSEINNRFPSSVDISNDNLPDYFNWKDHNGEDWTTPVKDQGRCGSCGVVAGISSLQSLIKIKEGCADMNPDLSVQYVLSCLPSASNEYGKGCTKGGIASNAYKYMISKTEAGNFHNGIIWESCFPYQAKDLNQGITCDQKCSDWEKYLLPLSDYGSISNWDVRDNTLESIELIKNTVMQHGPTVAGMDSVIPFSVWGLLNHSPEDYYPDKEEGFGGIVNHEVVIVGWKDDPSINNGGYWICESTWGPIFGYDGFFNIEYGALFIGILLEWADYDPESYDWPPNTPDIKGPTNGNPEQEYEYTFSSIDPDGVDDVFYYINWGDDSNSGWLGPFESSEVVTIKHTWENKRTYNIRAKAKDPSGLESDWGSLSVNMPRNKQLINTPFQIFLRNHPLIYQLMQRF
jgi:C1A family cysteine protease